MPKNNYQKILKLSLITVGLFFYGHFVSAEALNLPKDSEGWTIFTPSDDSRIMYVSATGNDYTGAVYDDDDAILNGTPFTPGAVNAFATYAAAYAHTRDGYPDWILMKRGDTLTQTIGADIQDGRSATEPFLIAAYGTSGLSPILRTGANYGLFIMGSKAWVAVSGISFYAHTRDPYSPTYVSNDGVSAIWMLAQSIGEKIQGILIEGCSFKMFGGGLVAQGYSDVIDGLTLYRNVILDSYYDGDDGQGIYIYRVNDLIIKENIVDHNGWLSQAGSGGHGEARMFGHNSYIHEAIGVLMEENIFSRAGSSSNKFRSDTDRGERNIVVNNNLNIDGETGYAFNGEGGFSTQFVNITVTGNVLTNLGYSQPTNRTLGWGFELNGVETAVLSNNYIINQPLAVVDNCYGILIDNQLIDGMISGNVFYNFRSAHGLIIRDEAPASTVSGVTFSGNKIQIAEDTGYTIDSEYDTTGKWTFSNNSYYSSRSNGTRFILSGTDRTDAQWATATGDNSTFGQITFPDSNRTIETYQTSVGETATLDAFHAKTRAQGRYSWDTRYTAAVVNAYIKAGFTANDTVSPNAPTGLNIL